MKGSTGRVKGSLKTRFVRFSVFFVISLVATVVLANRSSYSSLKSYDQAFFRFDKIVQFYDSVERMSLAYTEYIYNQDPESYRRYLREHEVIVSILDVLSATGGPEFRFRVNLLQNMVDTYDEHVRYRQEHLKDTDDQTQYEQFMRLSTLIMDTYPSYSKLITREMQTEKQRLSAQWKHQLTLSLLLVGLLLVSSLLFFVSSLRSVTKPIDRIIGNIGKIKQGDFEIADVHADCQETDILVSSFDEMARDLKHHILELKEKGALERQLIEQENENLRMAQMLTESKLTTLQRQMNPHFLFNTLSMISKLAYIEGAETTSNLMVRTASLLRYSLDMSSKESNLALEVGSIRDYFSIQERRLGDRIGFSLEVPPDEDLSQVPIPGMVLQPLVENSIVHGLRDKSRGSFVSVRIERRGSRVCIFIEDDGVGMPQPLVEKLNGPLAEEESTSIGLANVRRRLGLFYGDDFRFRIESEEDCGVLLTLDIPARTEAPCILS